MTTMPDTRRLELTVSNFGPIAEGRVELRPLTVFVGPSNTGKSYLAMQLYALHRIFNSYSGMAFHRALSGEVFMTTSHRILEPSGAALSEKDVAILLNWASESLPEPNRTFTFGVFENRDTSEFIELPEPVAVLVRSALGNISDLGNSVGDEISRCFGIDNPANLVRHQGNVVKVSLASHTEEAPGNRSYFSYEFGAPGRSAPVNAEIPDTAPLRIRSDFILPWFWHQMAEEEKEHRARIILGNVAGAVVTDIVGSLSHPAHYLPADRAGVMHAHQVAVRGLIASASRAVLRPDSPMPVLSGVLGDFLEQLVALASDLPFRERGRRNELALHLEQKLMRGAVRVERSQIDYPSFVYRPLGWERDMPLANASSMVSELAPVVLYLRHVVQPGDTLIIEEPESHLHPAMQVEFTRLLAAAIKSGIRIIITTHSEWILEELANLVRLSELPVEQRSGIPDTDVDLNHDEVGAWFFDPSAEAGGSVVREIPLDVESGTFPAGYGLITEALYKRWSTINRRVRKSQ